jgi:hypothetical protein
VTTARKADPIRRMTTKCGETRCRFVIDVGRRPNGKRPALLHLYQVVGGPGGSSRDHC